MSTWVTAFISETDTKSTLGGLQAHTTYKIEVNDFGRVSSVERRYDDFNNLHGELVRICGEANLPPMPKKQIFGSLDSSTVEQRKPQLEKIVQAMLKQQEALLERQNLLWNFLEVPLAAVACTRFLIIEGDKKLPYLKQLQKLANEPKYANDRYRLGYQDVVIEEQFDCNPWQSIFFQFFLFSALLCANYYVICMKDETNDDGGA